jgi:leucyl-tRNA synthetase
MVQKGGVAMSKSKGNVVGAEEMAEKYGADTGRLYTLFAAPPEKDLEWSEESIEGSWRFLNRVYRLVERHAETVRGVKVVPGNGASATAANSAKEKQLLRKTHQTLRRVTQDFETRWHFNAAIALIMELTNEIHALEPLDEGVRPEVQKEVLELLTLMLAPMTPHIAAEMWEMLGHEDGQWTAAWPAFDAELARETEVEIVVQVNGRVRGKLKVAAGIAEEQIVPLAKAEPGVATHLDGKRVVKIIFVADKLVNLVVS